VNSASDTARFFDAMRQIAVAANARLVAAKQPEEIAQLWRIASLAAAVGSAQSGEASRSTSDDLALATIDAAHLLAMLDPPTDNYNSGQTTNLALARQLADRILDTFAYALIDPPPAPSDFRHTTANPGSGRPPTSECADLNLLARRYEHDATEQQATMKRLYAAAIVFVVAAAALAVIGVERARGEGPFVLATMSGYGVVAVGLLGTAAAAWHAAARHRSLAAEAWRIHRQLEGLTPYLAPLPPALRNLLRGVLAQRLFPPLLEREEPWREPRWPDTDTLLEAIHAHSETLQPDAD
jgi:hypothetical protein